MSSDSDAVCVAIALTLCLKRKKRIAVGPNNGAEEDNTQNLTKVLRLE